MTREVVNLTPHAVTVLDANDNVVEVHEVSGQSARLAVEFSASGTVGAATPCGSLRYGAVTGLPDPVPGRVVLVSVLVKLACPHRSDLAIVADEVRDPSGRILGCRGLATDVRWDR